MIGNYPPLSLIGQIKELKKENQELRQSIGELKQNTTGKMKKYVTGSLKTFLKNNLSNGDYIIFPFFGLTDNPFSKITTGFALAVYSNDIGTQVRVLGFSPGNVECVVVALT